MKRLRVGELDVSEPIKPPGSVQGLPAFAADNEMVTIPANHSVDETVERLKSILQSKGVMLFAVIDHSGEAAKVGMKMPLTKLLIFGNPIAGTPLMLAAPSIAIDLPLKILCGRTTRERSGFHTTVQSICKNDMGYPAI